MSTPSTDLVQVLAADEDGRVVLWERDAAHPGGEVFLAAGQRAYVARTPRVEALLASGALIASVLVGPPPDDTPPAVPSAAPAHDTRPTPRATRPSRTDGTR